MDIKNLKKKIVIIISDSRPGGGAEKQSLIFAESLHNLGWDVDIYSEKFSIEHLQKYAPSVTHLTNRNQLFALKKSAFFISFLKNDHILGWILSLFGATWVPFERIHPYYYREFGNSYILLRWIKFRFLQFIYATGSKALFVQTDSADQAWTFEFKYSKKVFIIPNSYKLPNKQVDYSRVKEKLTVMIVGRLIPMKDPFFAISAFRNLLKISSLKLEMNILGQGELERDIADYIDVHGLKNEVKLLGFRSDLSSILLEGDLYLMTSHMEGMPNALGEAMSFGYACVATDFPGGARELLGNSVSTNRGQIVEKRSEMDVALAMKRILEDRVLSRELGESNRNRMEKYYNSELITQRLVDAIEAVSNL